MLFYGCDERKKTVSAADQGLNAARCSALIQDPAQSRHLDCEVCFLDGDAAPDRGNDLVFRDERATALYQEPQQVQSARAERDGLGARVRPKAPQAVAVEAAALEL